MNRLSRWLPRRREREIRDELEAHLAMAVRDRIAGGEPPEQARWAAMRELGNVDLVADATRRIWTSAWAEQLLQDLRLGFRILWQAPAVSVTAVILVALVIGGNTTIYSVVHGMLTAPAAGVTSKRLVTVAQTGPDRMRLGPFVSYPNYLDYARAATHLQGSVAWSTERLTLGVDDGSYAVFGAPVTAGFFDTFGVGMALGRALDEAVTAPAGLTVVISERLWRERFAAAADVVGRTLLVNGHRAVIVGIAGAGFRGASLTPGEDIWLPLEDFYETMGRRQLLEERRTPAVLMAGRLAPGATLTRARAEMAALADRLRAAYPDDNRDAALEVFAYSATALLPVAELAPRFLAIFTVVTVLTLLIVSANVANLMLARAVARQRETAVRQALGASRGRIVRMVIAEGLAVSLTAWAAACLCAWWVSRILARLLPPSRQGFVVDFTPDWQVVAYATGLAVAATLAFTLAPALRAWGQPVLPWLKAGEQSIAAGRLRLSSGLVVVQLACSVLLLACAGLAYRSMALLDAGDVGFAQEHLLLVTVRAGFQGAPSGDDGGAVDRAAGFASLERVREHLDQLPGVESVTYSRRVPGPFLPVGTPVWRPGALEPMAALRRPVGPDYLRTLGVRPVLGRDIEVRDRRESARVAVVNQHLAAALFGEQPALGRTIELGPAREVAEIVGIAPNASFDGPTREPHPAFVFVAEQQLSEPASAEPTYFVRYRGDLDAAAASVRKTLAVLASSMPIVSMRSMAEQLHTVTELGRMIAMLLACFAVGSLLVASLGQYAIAMFNMRRRTRDFGIRLSLGASTSLIQRSVLCEALELTAIGLLIGFVLSVGAAMALKSVLFGVTPADLPTYAAVGVILAITSVAASFLPAWRAGRVSVVEALRQE